MDKNAIYTAKKHLIAKDLGGALQALQPLLTDTTYSSLHERITQIGEDYKLMLDYMRQGYNDPSRDEVYVTLLRKLDRTTNEATRLIRTRKDLRISSYASRAAATPPHYPTLSQQLNDFVSDVALLSLEEGDTTERSQSLYQSHHQLMSRLFEHICFSGQWHADDQSFYEETILSPTTDIVDAALLVSAITLSSITYFDVRKYTTLAHIYQQSHEEVLRQRALVGWALTTTRTHFLYSEVKPLVEQMTSDRKCARQLLELQTQLFFCINAERDKDEIQRNIMPNLMKNNGFDITRNGIVEKDEDPMQDILDPESSDRSMEELERSFHRMAEMQRSGSDIYFGGFSQMKRYPFFYTLSNWFCPFYESHPGLVDTISKLKTTEMIDALFANGNFCDSDKYSFALALASVIERLPTNIKSAIEEGTVSLDELTGNESSLTAATIRLLYLQDLYRFFRLCDQRICFFNPFGGDANQNALLLTNDILRESISDDAILSFGNFLLKHGHIAPLQRFLDRTRQLDTPRFTILKAYCAIQQGQFDDACDLFEQASAITPDDKRCLGGLARAAMLAERYEVAERAYARLYQQNPEKHSYALNHSLALIKCGKAEEATQTLYKLSFEHPDDSDITRVLAWALLACHKPVQAQKEYERLQSTGNAKSEDLLNQGYCHWATRQISEALILFERYMQSPHDSAVSLGKEFQKDKAILLANGISEYEIQMMCDLMSRSPQE